MLYIPKLGVHDFVAFVFTSMMTLWLTVSVLFIVKEKRVFFAQQIAQPSSLFIYNQYHLNNRFPHDNSLQVKNGMLI